MKRLIIFLVRKKLGLKKYQNFRFVGQKSSENYYYFDKDSIRKVIVFDENLTNDIFSSVSLNWLLDDNCKITTEGHFEA